MDKVRTVDRRSFLARVAGAGLVGAALVFGGPEAQARRRPRVQMAVDTDPRDPARPIGAGGSPRRPARPPAPPPARLTDRDTGPNSDPLRYGSPAPAGRFILCPGNRRCPGRNR